MTDSGSNGWGWVLGLRQNGTIVMNFSLSSGYSGIMSTSINARLRTDIVVVKSSRAKSDQIGFKILYNISGTVLYSRASGSSFSNNIGTVIGTFCPSYCPPTFGSSLENL